MGKKTEKQTTEQDHDTQAEEAAVVEEVAENVDAEAEQLREELNTVREEAKSHQEQYLRTLADMENLRKRTQREKEELAKFANENILREILPVIDNLERAMEHVEQSEDGQGLVEGVQMTLTQFNQVLSRFGVESFETVGEPFDPALHQAMGQMETADQPINTVVQQMQKGYQLNDRLLRPAFVMVAKAPSEAPAPEGDEAQDSATDNDQQSE